MRSCDISASCPRRNGNTRIPTIAWVEGDPDRSRVRLHVRVTEQYESKVMSGLLPICLIVASAIACHSLPDKKDKESAASDSWPPRRLLSHDACLAGSPLESTIDRAAPTMHTSARITARFGPCGLIPTSEQMETDDHNPPKPTRSGKPAKTIEYTRTIFVPVFPMLVMPTIHRGCTISRTQRRLTLAARIWGSCPTKWRNCKCCRRRELFTVLKDGWHLAEPRVPRRFVAWQ